MATNVLFQENYAALNGIVKTWDRRLRTRQMLLWLPRSLLPGLGIGMVLAVVSRLRPWLLPQQVALATGVLMVLGAAVFTLGVWLWRRSSLTSARRFDVQFRLGERVSTALELSDGTIHSSDELTLRQLEDARIRASEVRIRDHIPLALSRQDWVIVLVLAAVLALLLVLPNPQVDALAQASAEQTALDNAAEQMRETTQDIASDTSLGNEERESLLEQLQTTTNTLEQPNITPEEAFAAISDMQSGLQDVSGELNRQSSASQAALEQAANALRQIGQQPGEADAGQNAQASGTMEQVTQNLDQIAQNAAQMSAEQRQQAADALQNAAQQLQTTNPQASQNLNDAAQQMQQPSPNQQQLQQSLSQAQQQMQQQNQQAQQQSQASQNLNNAAQQMQQSAQQISQSQQQQGQQSQQSQSQQGQQQQSQDGQQSQASQQGQQSQDGQQSQQGQQSQNGSQQQNQQGQSGAPQMSQQGSQNAEQAQSQQGAPSEGEQSQQGNPSQAQSLAAGDQPGDPQGSDSQGLNQQRTSSQDQSSSDADGQAQGEFEAVNIPRRIGPQANDGNNVELDPDGSNAPVQEGDFSQNPNGQVTVPYNQVFSDYANAANRALDSDYVPLGLRDVVRDYFTSLEPRR